MLLNGFNKKDNWDSSSENVNYVWNPKQIPENKKNSIVSTEPKFW